MPLKTLLNVIFPPLCVNCRVKTGGGAVCGECYASIPVNQTFFCGKCGLRFAVGKKICHKDFPYILGAATNYEGAAKQLIHAMKFGSAKNAADELSSLLVKYASALNCSFADFIVVPIPLSGRRLRERGFNQSELLAEKFAAYFGLSFTPRALVRKKHSMAQSETKTAEDRRMNVTNCFAVKNPNEISGKNIILVDDVVTSGATMLEAAKTLKAAGARKITAMAAART